MDVYAEEALRRVDSGGGDDTYEGDDEGQQADFSPILKRFLRFLIFRGVRACFF